MPVECVGRATARGRQFAGRLKHVEDEGYGADSLLLLIVSGGFTYYGYRNHGKYGGLVPAMLVILLIYLLVGTAHMHR